MRDGWNKQLYTNAIVLSTVLRWDNVSNKGIYQPN